VSADAARLEPPDHRTRVCLSVRGEPEPPRGESAKQLRQPTPPTQGRHSETVSRRRPTLPAWNLAVFTSLRVDRSRMKPAPLKGRPPNKSANSHRQTSPPTHTAKRHRQPLSIKRKPGSRRLSHVSSLMSPAANRSRRKPTPPDHTAKQVRQTTPPTDTANGQRQRTTPAKVRYSESANWCQPTLPARNLPIIAPECVYPSGVNPHRRGGSPPNGSAN
jgi:hypothetical protein